MNEQATAALSGTATGTGTASGASEWANFWSTLEWGRDEKTAWILAIAGLMVLAVWIWRKDTRELAWPWRAWLMTLRGMTLLAILLVALLPQERRSQLSRQRSRVAVLIDTSASMGIRDTVTGTNGPAGSAQATTAPNTTAPGNGAGSSGVPTRAEQVREVLMKSPLLEQLRAVHDVRLYTFSTQLAAQATLRSEKASTGTTTSPADPSGAATQKSKDITNSTAGNSGASEKKSAAASQPGAVPPGAVPNVRQVQDLPWEQLSAMDGAETRLGEVLLQAVRDEADETLSGLVVVTDGQSNAGVDPQAALAALKAAKVKFYPVGVGSTQRPVNLQVTELQGPTLAHIGDGFTLTAFLLAHGLKGQTATVELLSREEQPPGQGNAPAGAAANEFQLAESRQVTLNDDGQPLAVAFDHLPQTAGQRLFVVRAKLTQPQPELLADDNEDRLSVEIVDRKTKVLLIAGGPNRDYQFVRNLLYRDKGIELDVWLQSAAAGASQESHQLLAGWPGTPQELFAYDIIVAFDADWSLIRGEDGKSLELLADWVFKQSGGLILVSGDVHTQQLASTPDARRSQFAKLWELFPVALDSSVLDLELAQSAPHPIELTPEGQSAAFLQLTDQPETSLAVWKEFSGLYRCYPTDAVKSGATVYAHLTDPDTGTRPPVLIASQYYGAGRVLYLGSPEFWRLRAINEEYYDRLWIKMIREVGQSRLRRGTNRAILLLDKKSFPVGATVQVQARLLDGQYQGYETEQVPLTVFDPQRKLLNPPVVLRPVPNRPGNYSGLFVATQTGSYTLRLAAPDSTEESSETISIKLPNVEFERPEQNVALLKTLARETEGGGRYLTLAEMATQLPGLLPDQSVEKVQYEVPKTLWDRSWVMYLLAGLLSLEWLSRKLLKLA